MFWCLLQILFEVLVFWLCHFHLHSCIWAWQIISISVVVIADAGFPFYGPNKVLGCICAVPIDFNHLYILFIVFFFPPDAHHFNMAVVSKCCNLLVSCGLNKVQMSQIIFTFTQTQCLTLGVNVWKGEICFSVPEAFMSHPCSYNLSNCCKV